MYVYDPQVTASRGRVAENSLLDGLGKRPEVVSPAVQAAAVVQLTDEIIKLAQRGAWTGVDKAYKKLESMGDEGFNLIPKGLTSAANIHTQGALAADALGEMKLKQTRLWRARKAMENAGVSMDAQAFVENTNDLKAIDMAYGSVCIAPRTEPKTEKERKRLQGRGPELARIKQPGEQLFAPGQLRSIEAAAKVIQQEGSFDGLLPAGSYTLAGQAFTVNAGTELIGKRRTNVLWEN